MALVSGTEVQVIEVTKKGGGIGVSEEGMSFTI
jgi:hypothetical protein